MNQRLLVAAAYCPFPVAFDGDEITLETPGVKELVAKLISDGVAEATTGLTKNRDEILNEKKALQKQFEDVNKKWEGLDAEQVQAIMKRLEGDEETKLIAEGKIDEVLEKRTDALKADFQKRLDASDVRETEAKATNETLGTRIRNLVIESNLKQAAAETGVVPAALVDVLARARGVFAVEEDDSLVIKDSDGTIRLGKDGKSPLSPAEWVDGMKEAAPHWFPPSQGGGAGGGGGPGPNGAFTINRTDARNPQQYQAAKAAAEKAGRSLVIVNDAEAA